MRVKSGRRAAVAAGVGVMLGALVGAVLAQYPQISDDLRKQAEAAKAEADRRSDEAFARALPEIEAWAKKGKPFIQDASRPGDLPQATIPAFPGAEGAGRHAFGLDAPGERLAFLPEALLGFRIGGAAAAARRDRQRQSLAGMADREFQRAGGAHQVSMQRLGRADRD